MLIKNTTKIFTDDQLQANKGMVEETALLKCNVVGEGQGEWAATDEVKEDVMVHFKVTGVKK